MKTFTAFFALLMWTIALGACAHTPAVVVDLGQCASLNEGAQVQSIMGKVETYLAQGGDAEGLLTNLAIQLGIDGYQDVACAIQLAVSQAQVHAAAATGGDPLAVAKIEAGNVWLAKHANSAAK